MAYLLRVHAAQPWGLDLDPSTHVISQAFWKYLTPEKMAVRRMITGLVDFQPTEETQSKVQGETLFLKNRQRMIKDTLCSHLAFASINRHCTCAFMSIHVHHTCASHIWVPPKLKKINKLVYFLKETLRGDTACFVSLMQIISEMSSKKANDSNRLY